MNRIQYISQGADFRSQLDNIHRVLDAGVRWVQLRHKKASPDEKRSLAHAVKELCNRYAATFIVNDDAWLCAEVDADGLHLGLSDTPVSIARTLIGTSKIIGGTANTINDISQRIFEGCSYIGLGPFAYTETKENLSPILGLKGYELSIARAGSQSNIPIIAIGGIGMDDIPALVRTGISGVALSGLLTTGTGLSETIKQINYHFSCQN